MLYPYNAANLAKERYCSFAAIMKPYLRPRWQGIDTLELYLSGIRAYWRDRRADFLQVEGLPGTASHARARETIRAQIDGGWLISFLLLYHRNHVFADFQWHWFNLAGYREFNGAFYVKAVTYGNFRWLDFREVWDTGYQRKGGLICISA